MASGRVLTRALTPNFLAMPEVDVTPPHVHLHPGREKGLLRGHPWVFSGAIHRMEIDQNPPHAGDWVKVFAADGRPLGWGHWGEGSIAVRLLTDGQRHEIPDKNWWQQRFEDALSVRSAAGVYRRGNEEGPLGFRWVHGEGDGLSGLVVDLYGKMAVVQTHTLGMHRAWAHISAGLQAAMGDEIDCIVNKSEALLSKLPASPQHGNGDGIIWSRPGKEDSAIQRVFEHGIEYEVDPLRGQKTGFFLDQRDNRRLLMEMVGSRPVLNAFSYTGGFSMAALRGGSPHVVSLDASGSAIAAANKHAELNGFSDRHEGIQGDVMAHLRQVDTLPPVVVLDPPAYAKSRSNRHKAVQGYKRLNAMAFKKMPEHGILWTFSCSQVVDTPLFEDTVVAAALESGRAVRILRRLGQPADHPTKAGHPEAQYLKGLVLHVK